MEGKGRGKVEVSGGLYTLMKQDTSSEERFSLCSYTDRMIFVCVLIYSMITVWLLCGYRTCSHQALPCYVVSSLQMK